MMTLPDLRALAQPGIAAGRVASATSTRAGKEFCCNFGGVTVKSRPIDCGKPAAGRTNAAGLGASDLSAALGACASKSAETSRCPQSDRRFGITLRGAR